MTTMQQAKTMLTASPEAQAAHEKRIARIADDIIALEESKQRMANRRPIGEVVIKETERCEETGDLIVTNRTVKKHLTTLDQLDKRGQLEKYERSAFDVFARAYALSTGAAADEGDRRGSTSRGISAWGNGSAPQFGPRAMSDTVLKAERTVQYILESIPEVMMPLAMQLLSEETGAFQAFMSKFAPLVQYGNQNGFNQEAQARASGATMVRDVCRVIHHALKNRGPNG